MIRGLYDWTIAQAERPAALWVLAMVAFVESSFFPIPPDVLMIPMIIAMPQRAFLIAAVATVSSVLGGIAGYGIGMFAFEALGEPMLQWAGKGAYFDEFAARYNEWGAWVVITAGVTPFPYKVITIMSGATALNFWIFVGSSIFARALRFFIVAGLLYYFGPPIRDFIEKRLGLMFTLFMILLIGGFVAVRYL